VRKLTRQDVADDFHIAMGMGAEAGPGLHAVLIDHPQRTEFDMLGIEVIGKGKRMKGLEPTVVGKPAFFTASDFVHKDLLNPKIRSNRVIKKRKI